MATYFDTQLEMRLTRTQPSHDPLKEALRQRDAYLETHPHLKSFQEEIDALLDKAGTKENRMAVLSMLMESKLMELGRHLADLGTILSPEGK